jgi:hypothetical protein
VARLDKKKFKIRVIQACKFICYIILDTGSILNPVMPTDLARAYGPASNNPEIWNVASKKVQIA